MQGRVQRLCAPHAPLLRGNPANAPFHRVIRYMSRYGHTGAQLVEHCPERDHERDKAGEGPVSRDGPHPAHVSYGPCRTCSGSTEPAMVQRKAPKLTSLISVSMRIFCSVPSTPYGSRKLLPNSSKPA
eukprot:4610947-Prymnesium_polylepis.1